MGSGTDVAPLYEKARAQFPVFETLKSMAFMENAGGSQVHRLCCICISLYTA